MARYKVDLNHKPRVWFTCDWCGKRFSRSPAEAKIKLKNNGHNYCKNDCKQAAIKGGQLKVGAAKTNVQVRRDIDYVW
jgi:flavoprotein